MIACSLLLDPPPSLPAASLSNRAAAPQRSSSCAAGRKAERSSTVTLVSATWALLRIALYSPMTARVAPQRNSGTQAPSHTSTRSSAVAATCCASTCRGTSTSPPACGAQADAVRVEEGRASTWQQAGRDSQRRKDGALLPLARLPRLWMHLLPAAHRSCVMQVATTSARHHCDTLTLCRAWPRRRSQLSPLLMSYLTLAV